jgi:hypothetical protein
MNDALIEFVTASNRLGYTAREVAEELEQLGQIPRSQWPRATAQHWLRTIERCIDDGLIVVRDGDRIGTPTEDQSPRQMSLFD